MRDAEIKKNLKKGDLIKFHSWEAGGCLYGLLIEEEDDMYYSKLNIWRPLGLWYLQAPGIANIEVIETLDQVESYKLRDLKELLCEMIKRNMYCPKAEALLKDINVVLEY